MGVDAATFSSGGQVSQHWLPGGYSRINFIKGTGGLVSTSNVVIFGECRGGEPGKVLWFGSPTDAEDILKSGTLLDAVKHAFNPGGGLSPQYLGVWRVNPGTQATDELQNGATLMITSYAWDWGLHTNQLKRRLGAGTISGKKLSLQYRNNDAYVVDNIEKESFEIQYTGAGTACSMTISKTQLTASVTGGPGGEDLTVVFASFATIDSLVNYINDQSAYTCTLLTSESEDPTTELDSVTGQDIQTAAYTAHSDLQALIDAFNSSPWIGKAEYNDAAPFRLVPDPADAWRYFVGAVDGAYTSTEWIAELNAALQEDIQFVGASSDDFAIHALVKAHCVQANSVTGKAERQAILGGASGETVEQAAARAVALTSDAVMLAYPGFNHFRFDKPTEIKTWSPVYYAAKQLGMQAVLAINEPATNKQVDILEWEKDLSNLEAETLIKAGVSCGIKNKSGRFVGARTVTTYQGTELQRCEFSMMREALFVSRDLRTAVERSFVGNAQSNTQLGKVDGVVIGKLSQYERMGLFNGDPPYWGYRKTILGDQVKIEYNCHLTPPMNFMFITSNMHVFASTATA